MPYNTFNKWLFDSNLKTPIPEELLKTTSPINHLYIISIFQTYMALDYYLNGLLNNENLWSLPKDELMLFCKRMVKRFNVTKQRLFFRSWKNNKKIFDALAKSYPYLKPYEIDLLIKYIDKSENRDSIYSAFGLTKEKKKKTKNRQKKITMKNYLSEHFSIVKVN